MKNISIKILLSLVLFGFVSAKAQTQKDEIQFIQSIWGMEKREIVTQYMKFTPEEATAFWPVYDKFQIESQKLGQARIMMITDYANNVAALTEDKASELAINLLKNNADYDKLNLKYYKKMKKAINSVRAAQFIQLELYLQTKIRSEIQNSIPMIGELDKTAK